MTALVPLKLFERENNRLEGEGGIADLLHQISAHLGNLIANYLSIST